MRRAVAVLLASVALVFLANVPAARAVDAMSATSFTDHHPCLPSLPILCTPPPDTPSPTLVTIGTPSAGESLPPTATPVATRTPVPTPEAPLPAGGAPQVANPEITPAFVASISTVPSGTPPASSGGSFGFIVLLVFVALLASAAGSAWLFYRLR